MAKYFGTDGFRGGANTALTADHAYKIGRFLGWYYRENGAGRIVIGKDTRRSSYMFECALAAGITASGSDACLLHVTTTPSVSYVARTDDFDCGIMISASHNPYYDNGIKLINGLGEKMGDDVIALVEDYLDGESELPLASGASVGVVVDYAEGRNRYIAYLISLARFSFKGKRIGLDCANGSTWMIAKSVFDALGADTYVINNAPNGENVNLDCGSTHIGGLQRLVRENHLDAGFAFDGDADRCLAVDERGELVDGDMILYIYGRYMQEHGTLNNSKVVTTVMSNLGLYKAFERLGIAYERTAVGDRYVYECMHEHDYLLGGEQSGHIIFLKYANTGDGMITALKLMQVMLDKKLPLSALCEGFRRYPQVLKNVRVSDLEAAVSHPDVQAAAAQVSAHLGDNGRLLLRKSGTEPLVRVMVEAEAPEACECEADFLIAAMAAAGFAPVEK